MLYNSRNTESGNGFLALVIGLAIVLGGVWFFTGISPLDIIVALLEIADTASRAFSL